MTEYNLLWQKGFEELKEVDIDLAKLEDVAGWFYLRNSGLTHEQKERVLSILPDEHYPVELLKKTMVRLFPGVHLRESGQASSPDRPWSNKGTPGKGKTKGGYQPRRSVLLTEAEDEYYEEEDEQQDEEYEEQDVAEALKTEVEEFYEELQAQGDGADSMWDQGEKSRNARSMPL